MTVQQVVVVAADPRLVDEPIVMADDLGLTRGDGCFDAVFVARLDGDPLPYAWSRHFDRFVRSASALGIAMPPRSQWVAALELALRNWAGDEGVCKLVLTRGREIEQASATAFLTLADYPTEARAERAGITLATLDKGITHDAYAGKPWLLGGVKTLSYATNLAAKRTAHERGANDALWVTSDGYALESPTAGIVWLRNGRFGTTRLDGTGILDSITVAMLAERLAGEGERIDWTLLPVVDLATCDAVWSLSAGRGATPVTAIDGRPIATSQRWTDVFRGWLGFDRLSPIPRD